MTEEKEKEKKYELVRVPTEHVLAISSPSGDTLSTEEGIVLLLNKLDEVKKLIG